MRLILGKLGLRVNEQEQAVPYLSRLHLTAHNLADVSDLVDSWSEIRTVIDGDEYIKGENDVFRIEKEGSAWSVKEMKRAVSAMSDKLPTLSSITNSSGAQNTEDQGHEKGSDKKKPQTKEEEIQECIEYTANTAPDQILEYEKVVKVIVPHEKELPSSKETPFHHEAFYANLHHYHTKLRNPDSSFGKHLIYGSSHIHKHPPREEPVPTPQPPQRLHNDRNNPTRRPRPRKQRLDLTSRRINVLHRPPPLHRAQPKRPRNLHPIPRRPCHRPGNKRLCPRLPKASRKAQMAKRYLRAVAWFLKQPCG
jgi:hypothetical protein